MWAVMARPEGPRSSRALHTTSSGAHRDKSHAEGAGLQAAHVEQVGDEPGQPVQRLVGGCQQFGAIVVVEGHVGAAQAGDCGVDDPADRDRDHDEDGQREQVVGLGDGEPAERRGEEPVQQQRSRPRRRAGRAETADQRHANDRGQEQQDVVGERQGRPGVQQRGQDREPGSGGEETGDATTPRQGRGQVPRSAALPGLLGGGIDADQAVHASLDHIVLRAGDRPVHVVAERAVHRHQGDDQGADEDPAGHQNFSGNGSANTITRPAGRPRSGR